MEKTRRGSIARKKVCAALRGTNPQSVQHLTAKGDGSSEKHDGDMTGQKLKPVESVASDVGKVGCRSASAQ